MYGSCRSVSLVEKTVVVFTKDGDQHNNLDDMQCLVKGSAVLATMLIILLDAQHQYMLMAYTKSNSPIYPFKSGLDTHQSESIMKCRVIWYGKSEGMGLLFHLTGSYTFR